MYQIVRGFLLLVRDHVSDEVLRQLARDLLGLSAGKGYREAVSRVARELGLDR